MVLIFSSSYLQLNSIVISCQFQYNNHKLNFQNLAGEGSSNFLNFVRGDLILLDDDTSGEAVLTSGWCTGTCERTEERGDFPAEAVYVLPCLSRPPDDILVSCRFQQIYTVAAGCAKIANHGRVRVEKRQAARHYEANFRIEKSKLAASLGSNHVSSMTFN